MQVLSVTDADTQPRLWWHYRSKVLLDGCPSESVGVRVTRKKVILARHVEASVACVLECCLHPQSGQICIKIKGISGQLDKGPSGLVLEDVRVSFKVKGSCRIPLESDLSASPGLPIVSLTAQMAKVLKEQHLTGTTTMLEPRAEVAMGAAGPSVTAQLGSHERKTAVETTPVAEKGEELHVVYLRCGQKDASGASAAPGAASSSGNRAAQ